MNDHENPWVKERENPQSEIKGVKDPKRKQIFYFDDFLGTTGLDKLQKNEDKRLVEFMQEVNSNDNWRFVLTTREYILNAAKLRYESLAEPVVDLKPCIIEMSDYTQPIRGRILYNHIYFSDLDDAHKRALLEQKRYERIIYHPNYNPRIVEFMTNSSRVEGIPASDFFEAFLKSLTNPTMIWDHAFRHQLSEAGQHLILVMGSLGNEVKFSDLELAFRSFYNFRQRKIGFPAGSRDFENAVKELDGNFIKTSMVGRDRIVTLHNPSLSDFLEHYFATSAGDLMDLVDSAFFFDQFINLWRGRQGKTYSAFNGEGGERLLRVLDSNLMSPSCHFIRVTAGKHGDYYGVRVLEKPFETRLSFVFEVAEVIATVGARELRQRLLAQLESQLLSNQGAKLQLVYLLKRFAELERGTDRFATVLQAAKAYLLRVDDGSDFDDFEALGKFAKAFPESTKDDELQKVRSHFLNFCEGYDGSWADSPDDYRTAAEELAQVGQLLNVDVNTFCDELEARASGWEQELPTSVDDDRGDDDDEERWGRSDIEDSSQMFEELLSELDERDS